MQHNLYSSSGRTLNYPHHTKWYNNEVDIVTHPDKEIKKGDVVFVAMESGVDENIIYNYLTKPHTVIDTTKKRKAKGNHKVDFTPIHQKLTVELIKE